LKNPEGELFHMYTQLVFEKKEGYAKIILNRPEARNSITPVLLSELESVLEELQGERDINVVFLMGAGEDFCAGLDLKYALTTLEKDPNIFLEETVPQGPRIHEKIEGLDKPVIAAVHGNAVAGGFILAYFCDLIIATEDSRFGDAHARWGIVPGWHEPQRLARSIGIRRAKQFFLTCELVSAKEAYDMGLVWKLVPTGKLEEAVDEWGARFKKLSGISLSMIKQQLRWVMKTDWEAMLEVDSLLRKDLLGGFCTEEALERFKQFGKK
jgi:enoyl-CoA hydratase/carnithine racemase